jgi:hypothetical protein
MLSIMRPQSKIGNPSQPGEAAWEDPRVIPLSYASTAPGLPVSMT